MIEVNVVDRVLSALDTMIDDNPALEPAVDFYEEVLPILYGAVPRLDGLTLHMESAQTKLREGVPLLWGEFMGAETPGVEPNIELFMTLCRLAADNTVGDNSVPDGEKIIKAYLAGTLDLQQLLTLTLNLDHAGLTEKARSLGVDVTLLTSVANMTLTPICHAYENAFSAAMDFGDWQQGYCPVCGDWPILGEFRGSDKIRHLRCGRCTSAWKFSRLTCLWCNNTEREEIGFLFDPESETWRVDTCDHCKGYIKTKTTFEPLDGDMLLVQDLMTMVLDEVAGQEGYRRQLRQPIG